MQSSSDSQTVNNAVYQSTANDFESESNKLDQRERKLQLISDEMKSQSEYDSESEDS